MPSFVNGLSSEGGDWSVCPVRGDFQKDLPFPPKGNAALNRRLAEMFPVGTSESKLTTFLERQKFTAPVTCPKRGGDAIRSAQFFEARSFGQITTLEATILWKVDEGQKLIWTRGTIFYNGI